MKTFRFRFAIFFSFLLAMLMIVSTVAAAPLDNPVVTLSTAQSKYSASEDVLVTVNIKNPANHSVRILKWFTPAEGLEEPVFGVDLNGKAVDYTGAIYKRPAATGSDYISLKAGESVTYQVNLGEYYDLSGSGQYEIYYDAVSYILFTEKGNNSATPDTLTSESISLKIEGRSPKGKPTPPPPPPDGGNTFNACTVTQQAILVNAREQAKTFALGAEDYLLHMNQSSLRYTEWFGNFSAARYNTVTSHFTSLSNAWDTAGVTFDCKCKQNYYAYVYPNQPYKIYLCKVFWIAPLAGTDSQGGTLIHEMSHFDVVAGTDDFVYGQAGARNLAKTAPDNAVMNADNHEYFAENTPSLP